MACDGVGPSHTCLSLSEGMRRAGAQTTVFANRLRTQAGALDIRTALPGPLAKLPYRYVSKFASARTERAYLNALRPDDIAYLWPSASLELSRIVRDRGNFTVLEGINTRMSHARDVLDEAYRAESIVPAHTITDARIAEEEEKLRLADAIFAPSPAVEEALNDLAHNGLHVLSSSYGTSFPAPDHSRASTDRTEADPVFLFVGSISIRKGAHHLLRAWVKAAPKARLRLAGHVEPAVRSLCADELSRTDVELTGFVRDTASLYAGADVFVLPSLEEGDPLVTYEAASFGLPIIATPAGAGRFGPASGCVETVEAGDIDQLCDAISGLAESVDRRREQGAAALRSMPAFDWNKVGEQRIEILSRLNTGNRGANG